jgi:hypothetical protein
LDLKDRAESAYLEMEMEQALALLDEALANCRTCTRALRANLKVMRGTILFVAHGDEAAASAQFREALRLDARTTIDPMLSNPAVEALFERVRAKHEGRPAAGPPPASPYSVEPPPASEPGSTSAPGPEPEPVELAPQTPDDALLEEPEEASRERRSDPSPPRKSRVFVEAGYSLTLAYAHGNMRAATLPESVSLPGVDTQTDPYPENDSFVLSGTHGCTAPAGTYCVRVNRSGMTFAHGLHVGAGVFITERFALGARVRWSPRSGDGPLNNLILGLRAYYQLTQTEEVGVHILAFVGAMAGQIQVRPSQQPTGDAEIERPWARTGLGGAELGAKIVYRFVPNTGLVLSPELYTLFPDFSFGIQATLGIDVTF